MHQDPLLDAHIRAQRYWNVDGLSEIAIGLVALLVSACVYWTVQTARGSLARVLIVLAFAVGVPALMLVSGRVLVAIRRRFTYPRTGFVAYQRSPRPVWLAGGAIAVALTLVILPLRAGGTDWVTYLLVLQGVVPGALTLYFGRLVGLLRFQVIGVCYALWGVAVAMAGPGLDQGMIVFWAGIGAVFLLSGGLTFWRYVRLNPRAAQAQ